MARLLKAPHRLLRFMILIILVALTAHGVVYALRSLSEKNNELISEASAAAATEHADLTISKTVKNASGAKLTASQETKLFVFTVTFSDGGVYQVKIGQTEHAFKSGGQIALSTGQSAIIQDLPVGVAYSVIEASNPGYRVSSLHAKGIITKLGAKAEFAAAYGDKPAKPPSGERPAPAPLPSPVGEGSMSASGPEANSGNSGSTVASGTGIDLKGPNGTPAQAVSPVSEIGGGITINRPRAISAALEAGAETDPRPWLITLAVSACLFRYLLLHESVARKKIN